MTTTVTVISVATPRYITSSASRTGWRERIRRIAGTYRIIDLRLERQARERMSSDCHNGVHERSHENGKGGEIRESRGWSRNHVMGHGASNSCNSKRRTRSWLCCKALRVRIARLLFFFSLSLSLCARYSSWSESPFRPYSKCAVMPRDRERERNVSETPTSRQQQQQDHQQRQTYCWPGSVT